MNFPTSNQLIQSLNQRGIEINEASTDLSVAFRSAGVKRLYLVSMTGRCGSTWLAETLTALPNCGKPREYFSEEAVPHFGRPDGSGSLLQYIESLASDLQTEGAFGLKIDAMRLGWLSQICDLKTSFDPSFVAWVDMRRLNLVKQAYSFARAKASGIWHIFDEQTKGRSQEINKSGYDTISDDVIWREIFSILESERFLDDLYNEINVVPLRIVYEELLDSKIHVLQRVIAHVFPGRNIALDDYILKDKTKKIANAADNDEEIDFISRHKLLLNEAYQVRFSRDIDLSSLRRTILK